MSPHENSLTIGVGDAPDNASAGATLADDRLAPRLARGTFCSILAPPSVARSARFLDPVVARFDREIQFYVAYLAHVRRIGAAGLAFCYPKLSAQNKEENVSECYDLALARN